MADIQLTASLDPSQVNKSLSNMSASTKSFADGAVRQFDRIKRAQRSFEQSSTRGTGAVRGGAMGSRNASYIAGQAAMQAQDVAVQLQMGARMSTVIAQQGSQLLSLFGPKGMILGGVLAVGAAIVGWALGTKKADEEAKKYEKTLKQLQDASKINQDARVQEVENAFGPEAAEEVRIKQEFRQKLNELPMDMEPQARIAMTAALQREYAAKQEEINQRKRDEENRRKVIQGDLVQLKEAMAFRASSRGEAVKEKEAAERDVKLGQRAGMSSSERAAERQAKRKDEKDLRRGILKDMDREAREAMRNEQDPNKRSTLNGLTRNRMTQAERKAELERRIKNAKDAANKGEVVKLADENIRALADEIAKANDKLIAK